MRIDAKDAERIARELIAEIVNEWQSIKGTEIVPDGDSYLFQFSLEPTEIYRYAHRVERPASNSLFSFNPLAEATEIVIEAAFTMSPIASQMTPSDLEMHEHKIRQQCKTELHQLLIVAPGIFREATYHARLIAETQCGIESMRKVGRPDIARGLIKAVMGMLERDLGLHFKDVSKARTPKISQGSITKALRVHLPKFKETGEIPSQRQFAKTLGVTPKGWRQYLEKQKYPPHEHAIKFLLEEISKLPPPGTISEDEGPKGIN